MSNRVYRVADLFCGAGGSSSGAARAIANLDGDLDLIAVNHWDKAIATHTANHPKARHYCVNLDSARPEDIVPEGKLDLLMASPECVFFSRARGGKPVSDQRRMSAWHVQRWASALDVTCILVENVAEFRDWGPLVDGHPDPKKKGAYFQAWIQSLWAMGYVVDWKLVNAADYGDATTRTRFFLQARKDGKPIRWPSASHSATGSADLLGHQRRWRAARDVIDWAVPGRSILTRKKPLSEKTRRRIARGLVRFGGALAPLYVRLLDLDDSATTADSTGQPLPFVFANREHGLPKSIDGPIPTVTAIRGWNVGVVEPTIEPFTLGQQSGSVPRSIGEPLQTIACGGAIALIDPLLTHYYGRGESSSIDAPLATITTKDRFGLCAPVVVPYGPRAEARDVAEPLPTILTKDRLGVCTPTMEPFIGTARWGGPTDGIDAPLRTITTQREAFLVEPMVVPFYGPKNGQARMPRSIDEPIATTTTEPRFGVCVPTADPFIVPQFGERAGQEPRVHAIDDPLPAVTGHGAGALVQPVITEPSETVDPRRLVLLDGQPFVLDIRFRMLTNRELARAMGFHDQETEYLFTGNTEEVTRQIGNAVAVNTAAALVTAILEEG